MVGCVPDKTSRWMVGTIVAGCCAALVGYVICGASVALAEHVMAGYAKPVVDESVAPYSPEIAASGRITIAGSDTMQPLLAKLAMEFRRWHAGIKIAVQGSRNHQETSLIPLTQAFIDGLANSRRGDGKVSGHLGANDIQLLASSRPLTSAEIQQFRSRHGYEPTEIPIAQDAVAVYVHNNNPISGLTLEQVDAIFSATRKRGSKDDIRVWGQLGLTGEWEAAAIRVHGRDARSMGTLPFFKQLVLLDGQFKPDVYPQPGPASVVLAVSNDPYAIGYSGIGVQTPEVRPLPLAERPGAPFVAPTFENVMNHTYPLSRPLYLYVNKGRQDSLDPRILEFLKFINSREGQGMVVQAGVYPLRPDQVERNLSTITGTVPRTTSLAQER